MPGSGSIVTGGVEGVVVVDVVVDVVVLEVGFVVVVVDSVVVDVGFVVVEVVGAVVGKGALSPESPPPDSETIATMSTRATTTPSSASNRRDGRWRSVLGGFGSLVGASAVVAGGAEAAGTAPTQALGSIDSSRARTSSRAPGPVSPIWLAS
jgi:hypothetical protein